MCAVSLPFQDESMFVSLETAQGTLLSQPLVVKYSLQMHARDIDRIQNVPCRHGG